MSDNLVKWLRHGVIKYPQTDATMVEAADRIEELEAKLAKAMEGLESISGKVPYADDPWDIARTTLSELKGEK